MSRFSLIEAEFGGENPGYQHMQFRASKIQEDDDDDEWDDAPTANIVTRSMGGPAAPEPAKPKRKERQFTDGFCLCVFILYMIALAYVFYIAYTEGEYKKLTHGYDWNGFICGLDENVSEQPYTYWCAKEEPDPTDPGKAMIFSLMDPICVSTCPNSTEHMHLCPGPAMVSGVMQFELADGTLLNTRNISRTLQNVSDIKTDVALLNFCLPTSAPHLMDKIFGSGAFKSGFTTAALFLDAIRKSSGFLVGFGVMAILLGYAYLFVLRVLIKPIIYATFSIVDLTLFLGMIYFLLLWKDDWSVLGLQKIAADNDIVKPVFGETNAPALEMWFFIGTGILWIIFSIYFAIANTAIKRTSDAIATSFDALSRMPGLLSGPVWQIIAQMFCFVIMVIGMFFVMSLGEVKTSNSYVDALTNEKSVVSVQGLYRELEFTNIEWVYLFIWGFGFLWTFEMCKAWNQFATAHAIVTLQFSNQAACSPLAKGYWRGFRYHFGTIAFGAFIMGIVDLCSFMVEFISRQMKTPDGKVNKTVKAAKCACQCCLACMKAILSVTNQLVYADCVIHGHNYLKAAKAVMATYITDGVTMATLVGTTKLVKSAGIFLISVGGTLISYWILKNHSYWNDEIPYGVGMGNAGIMDFTTNYSSPYAATILGGTAASAFICISVAQSFMTTFDMVTDTLAYCSIQMDKMAGPEGYAKLNA